MGLKFNVVEKKIWYSSSVDIYLNNIYVKRNAKYFLTNRPDLELSALRNIPFIREASRARILFSSVSLDISAVCT